MSLSRAVFFDKDGTLVKNVPYNVNPDLIELNKGADECLRLLRTAGYKLFVITNQSGVARGFFEEKDLPAVWQKLNELTGAEFAGFYHCPHYPSGKIAEYAKTCDCRKPQPGMILKAAAEHAIDLKNSWFVGDNEQDIIAGRRAGCKTILFDEESRAELNSFESPDYVCQNLSEVSEIILKEKRFVK